MKFIPVKCCMKTLSLGNFWSNRDTLLLVLVKFLMTSYVQKCLACKQSIGLSSLLGDSDDDSLAFIRLQFNVLSMNQFSQWRWASQSWSVWLGKGRFLQSVHPTLRQWRDVKLAEQHLLLLVFEQGMGFCGPVICPDTFLPKFMSMKYFENNFV